MELSDISTFSAAIGRGSTDDRFKLLTHVVSGSPQDLTQLHLLCSLCTFDRDAFTRAMRACVLIDRENILALQALLWTSRREGRLNETRDCISRLMAIMPDNLSLYSDLLRSELIDPSVNAQYNIDRCLDRIGDPFTLASYKFQVGVRFGRKIGFHGSTELEQMIGELADRQIISELQASNSAHGSPQATWEGILHRLTSARSVAIVGNGPSLLGSGYGARIDAQEVVVRINYPVIQGHAADVGSRTDFIFFSENLLDRLTFFIDRDPSYRGLPLLAVSPAPQNRGRFIDPKWNDLQLGSLPSAARSCLTRFCYDLATTGCLTMCLCVFLNVPNVERFGFDFYQDASNPHYFDGHDQPFLGHDASYERFLVESVLPRIGSSARF